MGIPLRIVEVSADGTRALCESRDGRHRESLDLRLIGRQEVGGWVLAFLGAARSTLTDEDAAKVDDALAALEAVQRGESVDHLFADLVDREPELPDFLKA